MSLYLYSAFVLACIVLAMTPGPNMSLFIANSATYGTRAALLTVLGSATGLALLVAAATLGLSSIMAFVAEWFDMIRWIGAAYLVWLGIMRLRGALRQNALDISALPPPHGRWYWQGLAASLANPKVMLFLGAFFPQFIDPSSAVAPQLALLAATFVLTIAAVDSTMVLAFGSAKSWLTGQRRRFAEGFSGALLIFGGLWLAMQRRA
jgi:threonine/homoserine/homoserine lactone efflux protein